jgi:hypothetical protein
MEIFAWACVTLRDKTLFSAFLMYFWAIINFSPIFEIFEICFFPKMASFGNIVLFDHFLFRLIGHLYYFYIKIE